MVERISILLPTAIYSHSEIGVGFRILQKVKFQYLAMIHKIGQNAVFQTFLHLPNFLKVAAGFQNKLLIAELVTGFQISLNILQ